MTSTIQLVGVLVLAAVMLVVVVHGLVTWARSRGRRSEEDSGGGYDTKPPSDWGDAGSGDSGAA